MVFFKGSEATLAWDPPSSGVVDHYVIEVTITREFAGPVQPSHIPASFSSHAVHSPAIDGLHEMPYIFTADVDLDHN